MAQINIADLTYEDDTGNVLSSFTNNAASPVDLNNLSSLIFVAQSVTLNNSNSLLAGIDNVELTDINLNTSTINFSSNPFNNGWSQFGDASDGGGGSASYSVSYDSTNDQIELSVSSSDTDGSGSAAQAGVRSDGATGFNFSELLKIVVNFKQDGFDPKAQQFFLGVTDSNNDNAFIFAVNNDSSDGTSYISNIGSDGTSYQKVEPQTLTTINDTERMILELNWPPATNATEGFSVSSTTVQTNETIDFNASNHFDPNSGESVQSYEWDYTNDGTVDDTGQSVSHSYSDDGTYTAELTVSSSDGQTTSYTKSITVQNRAPTSDFTFSPTNPESGEQISFDGTLSSDPDGTIQSYQWDFGDGNSTTGSTVSHSYSSDGSYTVTLTVTDDDGSQDSIQQTLNLSSPPTADFTFSPTNPVVNQNITFDGTSSTDNGSIQSYDWEAVNTSTNTTVWTDTGSTITRQFSDDVDYDVTLTVTDNDGLQDSQTQTVSVVNQPPVADFSFSPTDPEVNETVSFDGSLSNDPDDQIQSYTWDFGDGSPQDTGQTVTHTYTSSGSFNVTLTVEDDDGAQDSTTKTVITSNVQKLWVKTCWEVVGDIVSFNVATSIETEEGEPPPPPGPTEEDISFNGLIHMNVERDVDAGNTVFNIPINTHVSQEKSFVVGTKFHVNESPAKERQEQQIDEFEPETQGDRRPVVINGIPLARIEETKTISAFLYLLDEIDNIILSDQTGTNFRIVSNREFRRSLYLGSSLRRIIRYEEAHRSVEFDSIVQDQGG